MRAHLQFVLSRLRPVHLGIAAVAAMAIYVGALAHQAGVEDSTPSGRAIAAKIATKGIANFGEVTPNLYRGAQPSSEGFQSLKERGVDIVVDLRGGNRKNEKETVTNLGMRYYSFPSQCFAPKDETFAGFLAVVRENPGKKIFVHCKLGEDRTGMAIASYRMAVEGWTAEEAMREMRSFGFGATHHATCPGLADYEKSFPQRVKEKPAFQTERQITPPANAK